ncbi:phosphoribosylglycinamide formyltransferase [Paenalkalicoccus suaedae]|uniref:Phosphoribosylglycinamide formyltransferase n=1 Tax=Paenalkalicoccus suaedae TaxID=2592382 RepID=A0A859FCC4_9BACI|nr:phosphoribosylglycinamide formyltransferase [Paenalkalicoccus suaedae]QKS70421.1 phosphoribosylglycinamide formyltransferase [Paenalkalicoccus suaedae]
MNIAIFASGSGSNFEAMKRAADKGLLSGKISLLICDKPGALVESRAEGHGVPVVSLSPKTFSSKADYEAELLRELKKYDISFLVLAGYMRLVGPTLLDAFEGRIVNIHPSLLPSFKGLDAIGQALDFGVKVTGVTVHVVDAGMDTGPILAQESVTIEPGDTRDDVEKKIREVEHRLYPKTVEQMLQHLQGV